MNKTCKRFSPYAPLFLCRFLFLPAWLFLAVACSSRCDQQTYRTGYLKVFRLSSLGEDSAVGGPVFVYEPGRTDTMSAGVSGLDSLPFHLLPDAAGMELRIENDSQSYHLRLSYTPKLSFISHACGFVAEYENLNVISHDFDSVAVLDSQIVGEAALNIKLYLP